MTRIFATLSLVAFFLLGMASPAHADDGYLNEAVQGLQGNQQVYVSPSVRGVDTNAILQAIKGNDIAVVVLPEDAAAAHGGANGFLRELNQQTNHQTLIVVIGNDMDAGSSVLGKGEASQIVNEAEGHNGTLTSRIVDAVNGIAAKQQSQTHTNTSANPPQDTGSPMPFVFGLGGVAVLVVIAWVVFTRRKPRVQDPLAIKSSPATVRELLVKLKELIPQINDPSVTGKLRNIIRDTEEFFRRSVAAAGPDSSKETDGFHQKLDEAVKMLENYVDIQDNSRYYEDPDALLASGADAIDGLATGVLTAVRRKNVDQLLQYQVSSDILSAQRYR